MTRILAMVRGSGRAQPHGEALTQLVRQALAVAFGQASEDVEVRSHRGLITLRGEVGTIDDIDGYEYVVRQVPGVRDVDNLLRMRLVGRARPRVLSA